MEKGLWSQLRRCHLSNPWINSERYHQNKTPDLPKPTRSLRRHRGTRSDINDCLKTSWVVSEFNLPSPSTIWLHYELRTYNHKILRILATNNIQHPHTALGASNLIHILVSLFKKVGLFECLYILALCRKPIVLDETFIKGPFTQTPQLAATLDGNLTFYFQLVLYLVNRD